VESRVRGNSHARFGERSGETGRPRGRYRAPGRLHRQVFHLRQPWRALRLLDDWLIWARRCRLPAFVKLARSITEHRAGIEAALVHDLSNARVESMNARLRLLTRIAFGFRSPDALIALAMLSLDGYCPPLPGRS
jgi:transposase